MAIKSKTKLAKRASRLAAKKRAMENPGSRSRYARKSEYCKRNGVWGFQVNEPKPWK